MHEGAPGNGPDAKVLEAGENPAVALDASSAALQQRH